MPITRSLLRGPITYSEAKEEETNILQEITYVALAAEFRDQIEARSATIEALVAHHLNLKASTSNICISDRSEWLNGSFNLCVPVTVKSRRVLMRFPLPYKMAEAVRPGNGDEKVRCEAATYAWIREECPSIPTTCLLGFGLSTGQRFTLLQNAPLLTRCFQYFKRQLLSLLGYPIPSQYVRRQDSSISEDLGAGYLLLDFIEKGEMLSLSYFGESFNSIRRSNLFHSLARIKLSLSRKPLPCIGSLTIDDNGFLSVTNRPFTLEICQLENGKIPLEMPRDTTYSRTDTYVRDVLSFHDNRLRYQLNGVTSMQDCISQMSALSTMRTICSDFFDCRFRNGPFVLTFTDLHPSNLFVDKDWNVTNLLDLEWACVRPIEMQHPPYWMTRQTIGKIDEAEYDEMYKEYLDIVQQEERKILEMEGVSGTAVDDLFYTNLLGRLWESGTFWYCLAIDSPAALHDIFYKRLQPRYPAPRKEEFERSFYHASTTFWCPKAWELITSKIKDKEEYDKQLRDAFQVSPS